MDAGCNDLLVTYLYCRFTDGPDYPGETESIARMKRVAKGLLASRYSPLLTAMAQYRVGSMLLSSREVKPAFRKEAQGYFDESLALLAKSVASDQRGPVWEEWWYDLLQALLKGYRESGMDGPQALERIEKEMSKTPEVKALQLHFRGNCWLHMGWEARSQAFAPNVPPEQMKTFQQSLEIARSALEESWNLQPGNAKVAQHRLEIEKGIGGDRATMELWFERAMKADSDGYDACWTKLDWLDPKWHGTAKEMLAFGRACRDTKNARAGITLLEAIR